MHKRWGTFAPPWIFCIFVQNFTEGDMTNYCQSQFVLEEGIIKKKTQKNRDKKKKGKGRMGEKMSLWPLWICRAPKQHYQNETGRLIIHTADSWIQEKGRTQKLIWPIH